MVASCTRDRNIMGGRKRLSSVASSPAVAGARAGRRRGRSRQSCCGQRAPLRELSFDMTGSSAVGIGLGDASTLMADGAHDADKVILVDVAPAMGHPGIEGACGNRARFINIA